MGSRQSGVWGIPLENFSLSPPTLTKHESMKALIKWILRERLVVMPHPPLKPVHQFQHSSAAVVRAGLHQVRAFDARQAVEVRCPRASGTGSRGATQVDGVSEDCAHEALESRRACCSRYR